MKSKYSSSVLKEQTRRSTIEAVSRTHNEPSWPAEASHKWWGDRARQAGPKGWPRTSCSGFSRTTCWLKGPSVPWAGENRQTQQWLKTCLTTKLPFGHSYSHGTSQERPRHAGKYIEQYPGVYLREGEALQSCFLLAGSKDLSDSEDTWLDWIRHFISGHLKDVSCQTAIVIYTL